MSSPKILYPDQRLIDIAKEVVEQNKIILEMNRDLLKMLLSPVWIAEEGDIRNIRAGRPGEIIAVDR